MPTITLFWFFGGLASIAFGFCVYLLVRSGKKGEKAWRRAINREPKWVGKMRVELEFDEHEDAIAGNEQQVKK